MFRGMKNLKIFLALVISLSVPIFSGYFLYCDLAVDNPFSPDAKCENEDIDDFFSVPKCETQLKFSGSIEPNAVFPPLFPETNAIDQVSPLCSLSFCLEQKSLVLRC